MDQKKDQPANGQTDQQTNQPNNEPLDGVGASWLPTSAPHAKEQVTSVVRKEGRRDVKGARRQRQYSVTDFDFKWEYRVNLLENQQMFLLYATVLLIVSIWARVIICEWSILVKGFD